MTIINHCPISDIPANAIPFVVDALHARINEMQRRIDEATTKQRSGEPLWVERQTTARGVVQIPRFYFIADWRYLCPYAVIDDAKRRIEELTA